MRKILVRAGAVRYIRDDAEWSRLLSRSNEAITNAKNKSLGKGNEDL